MADKRTDRSEPHTSTAMWVARGVFTAATVALVVYLFVGYRSPTERKYPERERVVYWHMWTANWGEVVERIVDRFNESQDRWEVVPLTIVPGSGSLKTLIATAGGSPPDCMSQWEPVIPAWAEKDALMPLDTLMSPQEWEALQNRFYPAVRAIGAYKGHFYGLSTGMNAFAIYYRPDCFREAGLDPDNFPKTLEEFDEAAHKLFKFDDAGRITRIGFVPAAPGGLVHYSALFGGTFYDAETDGILFTHPRTVAAMEWMKSWFDRYGFEKIQTFEAGLASTARATWPFVSGSYAMVADGQWRVEQLARYAPDMEYRTAPIPPPKGGKPLACWSNGNFIIIPKGAKNKEGAWAFMRFWSGVDDPERAAEFYTWGGWLPIMPDIAEARIYQEYCDKYPAFRTFLKVMASPNIQVSPPVPVQAYMMNRLGAAEETAVRGILPPKEALARAAEETHREMENLQVGRR